MGFSWTMHVGGLVALFLHWFPGISIAASLLIVFLALRFRGRMFATFGTVLLTVHNIGLLSLLQPLSIAWPVLVYLQIATHVHLASLIWAGLRPAWFRRLVSIPTSFFMAATFLSLPFALVNAFVDIGWAVVAPFAIAAIGVFQSSVHRRETVELEIDGKTASALSRWKRGDGRVERPLKLIQITDPHIGPFMPVARLRRICERAVERDPDLILLTGDFLTMESSGSHEPLAEALAPLANAKGRVFACRGNHDHEAPAQVARALKEAGVVLLNDDARVVQTAAGPVHIVGMDFAWSKRAERMADVLERHPRPEGAFRLVLLHDPGAFKHLADGEADLVLSGHTHGGQLGLVSLGIPGTFVSLFTDIPDHGFWALGTNRLYVHRGTGHYGFPLRLGVPTEDSVLCVHPTKA